jgi:hypothetical protein
MVTLRLAARRAFFLVGWLSLAGACRRHLTAASRLVPRCLPGPPAGRDDEYGHDREYEFG